MEGALGELLRGRPVTGRHKKGLARLQEREARPEGPALEDVAQRFMLSLLERLLGAVALLDACDREAEPPLPKCLSTAIDLVVSDVLQMMGNVASLDQPEREVDTDFEGPILDLNDQFELLLLIGRITGSEVPASYGEACAAASELAAGWLEPFQTAADDRWMVLAEVNPPYLEADEQEEARRRLEAIRDAARADAPQGGAR